MSVEGASFMDVVAKFTDADGDTDAARYAAPISFAIEDGTILGWIPRVSANGSSPSTQAFRAVDHWAFGAFSRASRS
jgi:hypothetical protein